jgi:hypothetical protein
MVWLLLYSYSSKLKRPQDLRIEGMTGTVISVLSLAACAYSFYLAAVPPQTVPDEEQAKGVEVVPGFIKFWRKTFETYK